MNFDWKRYAEYMIQEVYDDLIPPVHVGLELRRQNSVETVDAEASLIQFARSGEYKRMLITGRPGSGKSFLLNRLAGALAQQFLEEIEAFEFSAITSSEGPREFQPDSRTTIPILIRLNMFTAADFQDSSHHLSIEAKISETLTQFGLTTPITAFFQQSSRFVVIIDDLDEVSMDEESGNLKEIRRFIEKYSSQRFVLAGRESAGRRFQNRFRSYTIANLNRGQVKSLLEQTGVSDSDVLFGMLEKADGLLDFLSTPYFLLQSSDFWNAPGMGGFNIGRLLLICIDRLIARQEKTEYTANVFQTLFRRNLTIEEIALQTLHGDEIIPSAVAESIPLDDLQWFLQMEFLSRSPSELRFTSRWIHAFLAAHFIARQDKFPLRADREAFLRIALEKMSSTKATFVLLLRDLLDEDYTHLSPDLEIESHFSQRDIELYSWIFERKVEDYARTALGLQDIRHSYDPPYLRPNEIDLYAEKSNGKRREVWILECKFRFPPYPKSIKEEWLRKLANKVQLVTQYRRPRAESEGESLAINTVLVTNGGSTCNRIIATLARKLKIRMYYVHVAPNQLFTQSQITSHEEIRVAEQQGAFDEN